MRRRRIPASASGLTLALTLAVWSPVRARSAQMADAPMTDPKSNADASHAGTRAGSMTEMMGAPGLVPFDIMTGQKGKWMIGYQFMAEKMDGNLAGTAAVTETTILKNYFAAPTHMAMQMLMRMVMYAPTDKLTLMGLLPYVGPRIRERIEPGV